MRARRTCSFGWLGWVRLLLGGLQRSFGRKSEIDSCGQIVLGGDVGHFEGTHRLGEVDLLALAFPTGSGVQVGGSLLQGVEHKGSALVIDAVVGQGVEHQHERVLHGMHVFEHGKLNAAGFAATPGLGHLHAAGANVEVEITETLAVQGGRIAVNAIFLEMVASRVGHKASKKSN